MSRRSSVRGVRFGVPEVALLAALLMLAGSAALRYGDAGEPSAEAAAEPEPVVYYIESIEIRRLQ